MTYRSAIDHTVSHDANSQASSPWNGSLDANHSTVGSHRAVGFADHQLCRTVASFEYLVITIVNDNKLTAIIWRMAYV